MQNEGPLYLQPCHPEPVASAFKVTERLLKLPPSFLRSWQQEEGEDGKAKIKSPTSVSSQLGSFLNIPQNTT